MEVMAKTKDEQLKETLGIRITEDDLARIDALAERMPVATRHGIARVALLIGLDAIEKDPTILLGEATKKRRK